MEENKRGVVNMTPEQQMQLQTENIRLKSSLNQAQKYINRLEENLSIKRMDYLFKIVEYAGMFSQDFVDVIINEIENTFKPAEQTNVNKEEENKDDEQ